jgi:hypothetical protein
MASQTDPPRPLKFYTLEILNTEYNKVQKDTICDMGWDSPKLSLKIEVWLMSKGLTVSNTSIL